MICQQLMICNTVLSDIGMNHTFGGLFEPK